MGFCPRVESRCAQPPNLVPVAQVLTSYSPPGMRMAHSKKVVAEARERRTKAEARRELGAYNRETLICRADGCHVVCAGRKALWKHRADKHA